MRILSVHRKLSVLEMCPYGEDRLYRKQAKFMYAELYERLTAPLFLFAVKNVALNEQKVVSYQRTNIEFLRGRLTT